MDEIRQKLIECFQLVFPDLPESEIPTASQTTVAEWDSVAAITMVNVIEDQFQIQLDMENIANLDSFEAILNYLQVETQVS